MACTCVVGLQWGDEAKGKIVDLLTEQHDFVVRYNGGANAGHTVVHGGKTFKLSLLPTGVLRRTSLGHRQRRRRLPAALPRRGRPTCARPASPSAATSLVSDHAHVIFPYHMEEETPHEGAASEAIGTTGRGIGPCYQDKVGRTCGIRVGELLHPDHLRERLRTIVARKNRMLQALSAGAPSSSTPTRCADEYLGYGEQMRPHVTDTTRLLARRRCSSGKRILFEAAQGSLLDVDHGTYPYVTSSNSSTAGIWSGSGVPARNLDRIVGVIKAYTTRVGRGPFPTELNDGPTASARRIRTHRPRIRHRHRPAAPLRLVRRRRGRATPRPSTAPTNWPSCCSTC